MRLGAIGAAIFFAAFVTHTRPADAELQIGKAYEIRLHHESTQLSSDGSSSSSSGNDVLVERVIGARNGGLELEYDLPPDTNGQERAISWQFPARVFRSSSGQLQLLNRTELEARNERWLSAAKIPKTACGSWYFTWNAFQIECDPETAIQAIERLDLPRSDIRHGAPYQDPMAREVKQLRRTTVRADGATFVVEMPVDPEIVRRERVESDLVVAEIMRRSMTREEAVRARAADEISGTITVTLETDRTGQVRRRIRVIQLETKEPSGRVQTERRTETTERSPVS